MSSIDEVSRVVGRLEAGVKSTSDQQTQIVQKLDDISTTLTMHCGKMEDMSKSIEEIKPVMADYQKVKQKGMGVLVGLSIVAGGAGAWIKTTLAGLFK